MNHAKIIKKDYKSRASLIFILFFMLSLVIIVRLYLIQIRQKDFFSLLAQNQHSLTLTIDSPRGLIYDRHYRPLCFNGHAHSAFILRHQMTSPQNTVAFLKKYYPQVYLRMKQHPQQQFFWIQRRLSRADYEKFNHRAIEYKTGDIQFLPEQQRFYPFIELAPVIGFTDLDNRGISGIEKMYCSYMQGIPTEVLLEKDARFGRMYFEKKVKKKGKKGGFIKLSVDKYLQFIAFNEIQKTVEQYHAQSGAAIIMDPYSGHILAMAQYPSFDPNQNIQDLEHVRNKTITECYEMGSVMKIFAALSALDQGAVTCDELIDCEGKISHVDGFRVENWKYVEVVPFSDVIRFSSNVGIAKVMSRVGPLFYNDLVRLGFGNKTGIEFPGEREGFVNHPSKWSRSSLTVMSFGYEVMLSIIQLAKAISIVANGGYDVTPQLIINPAKPPAQKKSTPLFKEQSINSVKNILEQIGSRYHIGDFRVMGKTGTARVVENGEYSRKRHLYTFSGIVEKGNYRRVIVTFIQEPDNASLWASQVAAPLFQKIGERMVMYEACPKT